MRMEVRQISRYLLQKFWIPCKPCKENRFTRWSQGWSAGVVKNNFTSSFHKYLFIYFGQDLKNQIVPESVSKNDPSLRKSVRFQSDWVWAQLCMQEHIMLPGVHWRWISRCRTREESSSRLLSCVKTWSLLGLENSDANSRDEAVQKWSELKLSHRFGILGRSGSCILDLWIINSVIWLGNRTVKRRTMAEKPVAGQERQASTFHVLMRHRCSQLWANQVHFFFSAIFISWCSKSWFKDQ